MGPSMKHDGTNKAKKVGFVGFKFIKGIYQLSCFRQAYIINGK